MVSTSTWDQIPAEQTPTSFAKQYADTPGCYSCPTRAAPGGATVYAMPHDWWAVVHPDGAEDRGCEYDGGITHCISGLTERGAETLRSVLGGRVQPSGDGKYLLVLGLGVEGETALMNRGPAKRRPRARK
jgi:hypothetical protein